MANVYSVYEKMHKMRAKLYQNYLPGKEGTCFARTTNEAPVTIQDIVASMKNRGGFTGSPQDALETVTHFLKETAYQLSDGFSINLDYFTIYPNIGAPMA
jgi:hypothetical protein